MLEQKLRSYLNLSSVNSLRIDGFLQQNWSFTLKPLLLKQICKIANKIGEYMLQNFSQQ